jgi:hypothetical protein
MRQRKARLGEIWKRRSTRQCPFEATGRPEASSMHGEHLCGHKTGMSVDQENLAVLEVWWTWSNFCRQVVQEMPQVGVIRERP